MANEKLNEVYYQPDHLWTGGEAIKKNHVYTEKRCQVIASNTNTLASSHKIP